MDGNVLEGKELTSRVTIEVPADVLYTVEVQTENWTYEVLPGESFTLYIYEGRSIKGIREVPYVDEVNVVEGE